jgi:hypothetical protein
LLGVVIVTQATRWQQRSPATLKRKISASKSNDPPPPDLAAGADPPPPELAPGGFSVTVAEACADCPLVAAVQVSV